MSTQQHRPVSDPVGAAVSANPAPGGALPAINREDGKATAGIRPVLMATVAAALICFLSYGLTIKSLGYFWDDWPGVLVANFLGPQELHDYVSSDRPASAWLFSITAPLLGLHPARAHAAAMVLRFLAAIATFWLVLGIWPRRFFEASAMCILVAVYPGFSSHSIAWIYSQGVYLPLVLFLGSLALSVWSARVPRLYPYLLLPSLLAAGLSIFVVEYFAGLELFRPVLLFVALASASLPLRDRIRRTVAQAVPYLAVFAGWAVWRLLVFKSTRVATDQGMLVNEIARDPARQILERASHAVTDIVKCGLMAWTHTINDSIFTSQTHLVFAVGIAILVATAAICFAALTGIRVGGPHRGSRAWGREALIVGVCAMFMGGLPVWAANRSVTLGTLPDRYSIPLMFGACLTLVGLTMMAVPRRRDQIAVVALVAGFAATFQYRTAERFALDWQLQKRFISELRWRAPGLKAGTSLLLIDDSALTPKSDYALGAAVNVAYRAAPEKRQLRYWVFRLPRTEPEHTPIPLRTGVPLDGTERSLRFDGSTSRALVLRYTPPGCLKVLRPEDADSAALPPLARAAAPLTNFSQIEAAATPISDELFGSSAGVGWCYYYETADRIRQQGDWEGIARIGDTVRKSGLAPLDRTEWGLFAEGYQRAGRVSDAQEMERRAASETSAPGIR